MATRRRIPVDPRLTALAVVLGVALLAMRVPAPRTGPGHGQAFAQSGGAYAVTALLALAIPAIVLATVAALRLRHPASAGRAAARPGGRAHRLLSGAVLLVLFTATIAAAALAARLAGPAQPDEHPAPAGRTEPLPADPPASTTDDQAWLLLAAAVLLALLAAAVLAHRQTQEADQPNQDPELARAVAQAITAISAPAPDARTAIIQCYAAMEGALTTVPSAAPHAADSPSEVLERALTTGAVHSARAWRLVELFDEARFSPHPMTEHDRGEAARALELILDELGGRR